MATGDEREALFDVADRLCAEFGYPIDGLPDDESTSNGDDSISRGERTALFGRLGPEEEALISAARRSLVRINFALRLNQPAKLPAMTVEALLDGAELVMRNELAKGNRLAAVMPDIVFLVAIPIVDREDALELSQRTATILAACKH